MKNKKAISIVLAITLAVLVFMLIIVERIKYQNSLDVEGKAYNINNYSVFFTVDECANRFIKYLSNGDAQNILLLLNKEYIDNNDINLNNVINKVDTKKIKNKDISLKTKKVLAKKVSENIMKYYVSGQLYIEDIDDMVEYGDYYLEINIDSETLIFDVSPYDGRIFKESNNERSKN